MTIEQRLADCTAALDRLTAALTASSLPTATKEVKAPKATNKMPINVEAVMRDNPPNEGDPIGTRYFHIPKHNSVYKQEPGMPDCTLSGAVIVTGAEYLKQKAEIEKKFPTASSAPTATQETPVAATTAPTATAPVVASEPNFEQVVEAMRALHAAKGRDGVVAILSKYDVKAVSGLNGKASNADLLAEVQAAC